MIICISLFILEDTQALKSKKTELRLYCDLLMQEIHKVKTVGNRENDKEPGEKNESLWPFGPLWSTLLAVEHFCIWHLETKVYFLQQRTFFCFFRAKIGLLDRLKSLVPPRRGGKTQQRILSDCHGCRILT